VPTTVRDAAFDVLRRRGLTTLFGNPGSTEIPFLGGLPDDLRFVLALHEAGVVGMATGFAIGHDTPALALLHTTAGLGNAVGALATARVNRVPLVVLVGQQDRRHLAFEPFLAGRLAGLAGEYPVAVVEPALPQDVPDAIERAFHAACTEHGPALVIVPMGDWDAPAAVDREPAAATGALLQARAADLDTIAALGEFISEANSPAIVVGAGAGEEETWAALVDLAERLAAPVFQESFGARAGFPQDHQLFAGVLPADRTHLRQTLAPHDRVLVIGAPAFRQMAYEPGRLTDPGTEVGVVTDDAGEAARSAAGLVVLAPLPATCRALADSVPRRDGARTPVRARRPRAAPPGEGEPLHARHVLAALAERLPANAVVVEEAPADRPAINELLPAREPLGYLAAAMGGLGFALPGAVGLRMAQPRRPVVAVVGDGAAVYTISALWTAAHYRVGALFVVLSNGGYAVMDILAERQGTSGPWPGFPEVEIAAVARGFGCQARRISTHEELVAALDEVVPTLELRDEPLVIDVEITPTVAFEY
jgi:benzoylformate decarboxylase